MYGYRARIGYCSPPFVTETFCHEFYQMAPKGVTLMITTLAVTSLSSRSTAEQISESHARSLGNTWWVRSGPPPKGTPPIPTPDNPNVTRP